MNILHEIALDIGNLLRTYPVLFLTLYILLNIASAVLYGVDKHYAVVKKNRIRESVLLLSAFLFGAVGAFFGMMAFRHKTMKPKFIFTVPIFAVLQVILTALCYCAR